MGVLHVLSLRAQHIFWSDMDTLNFTSVPGFSPLFTDFIAAKPELLVRFPGNTPQGVLPDMVERRLQRQYDRRMVVECIRETMHGVLWHPLQQQNIERLLLGDTSVVVTGQQAGLFGGPLYTLLKAQSAVAMARTVEQLGVGGACVPIFWVEDNDHDFAEIAQALVLDRSYNVHHSVLEEPANDERKPVGSRVWQNTEGVIDALVEALQHTEYTDSLVEDIRRAFASGQNITDSFVALMNTVVAPTGILFLSAYTLQQRGAFGDVIRRELEQPDGTRTVVEQATKYLMDAGYHGQAQPSLFNCMLFVDGKRQRIEQHGDSFRAGEKVLSIGELQRLAEETPELFSPTVLTRPLAQDAVLPTAVYIAGPGEIAYAAQLKELYEKFDSIQPAFCARHSATLVEKKLGNFLLQRAFAPVELFQPYERVEKAFVALLEDRALSAAFAAVEKGLQELYAELEPLVQAVDATLAPSVGRALAMSEQQLEQLQAKTTKARKRQEETALAKLRNVHSSVFPEHVLQERALSWLYFANKWGVDFLRTIVEMLAEQPATQHYVYTVDTRAKE